MATIIRLPARAGYTPHPAASQPAISALIPDWLRARRADGRRPSGIKAYGQKVQPFIAFAGDITVDRLSSDLIGDYKIHLSERNLEMSTVRNLLTVLRAFCAWCVAKRYLEENVALHVQHPHVEPPDPDPLSRVEIELLMEICDRPPQSYKWTWRRNRRTIYLMLYCGLRIAEVTELRRKDIDLDRGELIVRRAGGKGGKGRVVPFGEDVAAELEHVRGYAPGDAIIDQGEGPGRAGTPMGVKSVAHIFERWLARRGIDIHPHQLRKTFATELYLNGESLVTIQRLLGHADPKTTMRYIGASSEVEREAVHKLHFRRPRE